MSSPYQVSSALPKVMVSPPYQLSWLWRIPLSDTPLSNAPLTDAHLFVIQLIFRTSQFDHDPSHDGISKTASTQTLEDFITKGYIPGAHREKDSIKSTYTYRDKVKKDQNGMLSGYNL